MEILDLFCNRILWQVIMAWFAARFIRMVLDRKLDWHILLKTGGMPSAHAAAVASLTIGIGRRSGFTSSSFALAFVFAAVVLVDAATLRVQVGKQASIINASLKGNEKLKESVGHSFWELFVGVVIGIAFGYMIPM